MLNRLDAIIDELSLIDDEENPYNDFIKDAQLKIISAKQMYLAWLTEEY